jgi:hypothetical protein
MGGSSRHHGSVIAVAWSAIGLLAATLGVLGSAAYSSLSRIDALGARIDAQGDALGARIDALGARLDAQTATLSSRLDALYTRTET